MAAAEAGRDVAYFTFGDAQLMKDVHEMHAFLTESRVTVGKIHTKDVCGKAVLLYLKGGFPSWCHYRTVCINNSTHSMGMLRYSTIWAISPLLSPSIQPEPQSGLLPKLAPASSLSLSSFFFC